MTPRMEQRLKDQQRVKKQVQLRLSPETIVALRTTARARGLPLSVLAERLLLTGLEATATEQLEATLLPALGEVLKGTLDDHLHRQEDRLAKLLTRAILASDTTRRLLYAHMAKQWGAEQVRPVHEGARTAAINGLREKG